jgi:thiol-disulfide isomerase/thioredoxin
MYFYFAQVPDWTKTSCDGIQYNMHSELANGNAVLLDFSAMWCGSCNQLAPEIEQVHQAFGASTANVKVFGFLIEDSQGNVANCADIDQWDQNHQLTFPSFADCYNEYGIYDAEYGASSIPLILLFLPNENDPGASTLVLNSITGLGLSTNDLSNDIINILGNNGFWGVGINENNAMEKELVKIVDLLGRETNFKPNTIQLYFYSDGTTEKKFVTRNF